MGQKIKDRRPPIESVLWTPAQAGEYLGGVSEYTVKRLQNDGTLPVVWVRGRRMVPVKTVKEYAAQTVGGV